MSKDGVKTLFNVAALATNVLSERGEGSLIEFASSTQNIILVTVEDTLTHHAVTPEILKFCTNIYIGYYLQAVALLNTIGDVSVRQVLDRLNTNRSISSNAKDTVEWIAQESFLDYPKFDFAKKVVSLEAFGDIVSKVKGKVVDNVKTMDDGTPMKKDGDVKNGGQSAENGSAGEWMADAPTLAQGKIFDVKIQNGGATASIPVTVRLNPVSVNREMLKSMYARANQNNSFWNRLRRWKDGELETLSDMIFCNDIIADHARLIKQDKLKLTEQLEKKRRANKISTLLTQKTSLATASTISLISKASLPEIELAVGGRISDFKVREDIFARSGLIMLLVVDDMYETVTIYYRGQNRGMELTFGECKSVSKGNGPNVMEILRAFQAGQTPNI